MYSIGVNIDREVSPIFPIADFIVSLLWSHVGQDVPLSTGSEE